MRQDGERYFFAVARTFELHFVEYELKQKKESFSRNSDFMQFYALTILFHG